MARRGLVLFFTLGVSLTDWAEAGFLTREVAYFRRLAGHVGPVTFITYGGDEDLDLADTIHPIRLLHNPERLSPEQFLRRAPVLYRDVLAEAAIARSNQIKGSEAVIAARSLAGAFPVIRGGYLLSRFTAGQRLSLRLRFGLWRYEARLFHRAGHLFLPTAEDAASARRWYALPPRRLTVLPNFIDTDHFRPLPEITPQPGLIGFVGRFAPQKNLEALIEAAAGLKDVRLRLIGDGPLREPLTRLAAEKRVPIEMPGVVPQADLPRLLAECDLFVLPSLYEGLPKALMEAMSIGLPVVATPVHGSERLILPDQTGYLCDDPSPEAIRRALTHTFSQPDRRTRVGAAARETIRAGYSLESVLATEVDTYRRLGLV